MSGKSNLEDVVKGFQIGAVDYITKPFEQEELIIRVKNNLELKASRDIIKQQNEQVLNLNEELKNFLNIAIHDLKNSLVVIQGFLKLILKNAENFTEQEKMELISDILYTSDGMCKIVSNLLLISKFESNQIKPFYNNFNVNYLFSELLKYHQSKAEAKGIQIILNNEIDILDIKQDFNLLKECSDNLLSNAIKFSPNSTIVEIHSYLEMKDKHSKYLVIEVEDSGPGIRKTEQHLLFKKFAK